MTEEVIPDALVAEFKDLLHKVAEDVSKSAVAPAIESVQAAWALQLEGIVKSAEANQLQMQTAFETAFQQVMRETMASQESLRKAADEGKGVAEGAKKFIDQAIKVEKSLQEVSADFVKMCQSLCDDIGGVRNNFTENAAAATEKLGTTLNSLLQVENTFTANATSFSEEFRGRLDAVQVLLVQAKTAFKDSQKPVLLGLTAREVLRVLLISNFLLWGILVVFIGLRLAGVKM